ncbi:hypothetical protein ACFXPX_15910 [Kitasatospora sp. NPDC059146]|uniref:hypothetical protein n=1 Tax=Kitasatospora sp. NPDC059146 TaxID=3346741 RepID=UPI003685855A
MNRVPNAAKRAATLLGLATGAVLLAATAAQAAPAAPAAAEGSALSASVSASVSAVTLQPGAAAPAGVNGDPRAHIDDTSEWNTIASRPLPSGGQL